MIKYPIIVRPENTGYSVIVPGFDGGFTQGETMEEAIYMGKDVIYTLLENDYPEPTLPSKINLKKDDVLVYVTIKIRKE